jgi:uncharacterized membrane protein YkoI
MILPAAALALVGAMTLSAQTPTSQKRIRVQKDGTTGTASGVLATPSTVTPDTAIMPVDTSTMVDSTMAEWYTPTGATCSSVDVSAARAVAIKTSLYDPAAGMITPDSAKVIALCAVPGQIGSGEMNTAAGVTEYAIDIIPNHKKTHTKVIVDARTGAVLSSKQFGGLRGLTGWVRESKEHKQNVDKAQRDTMPDR